MSIKYNCCCCCWKELSELEARRVDSYGNSENICVSCKSIMRLALDEIHLSNLSSPIDDFILDLDDDHDAIGEVLPWGDGGRADDY